MKYTIKRGDTLSSIAKKYLGSANKYHQLAKQNNISNADLIYAGLTIDIPDTNTKTYKQVLPEVTVRGRRKYNFPKPKIDNSERTSSTSVSGLPNRTKSVLELNRPSRAVAKIKDFVEDVRGTFMDNSAKDIPTIIRNGISSTLGLEADSVAQAKEVEAPKRVTVGYPGHTYGDTIRRTYLPASDRLYLLPENLNLDSVTLGGRNRGSREQIKSSGIVIPTYKPLESYEDFKRGHGATLYKDTEGHTNKYYGYDKDGKFKVGTFDEFGPGDTMTQAYYGKIINFLRDNNGKLQFTRGFKDSRRYSPLMRYINESGDTLVGPAPLMTPIRSYNTSAYDNVVGGPLLLESDEPDSLVNPERRLLRGSIDNVVSWFEDMQKRHGGRPLNFYEVDAASYNRGLRTYDGILTSRDLSGYDSLNRHAGHAMYLK